MLTHRGRNWCHGKDFKKHFNSLKNQKFIRNHERVIRTDQVSPHPPRPRKLSNPPFCPPRISRGGRPLLVNLHMLPLAADRTTLFPVALQRRLLPGTRNLPGHPALLSRSKLPIHSSAGENCVLGNCHLHHHAQRNYLGPQSVVHHRDRKLARDQHPGGVYFLNRRGLLHL